MSLMAVKSSELSQLMQERAACILRMGATQLDLKWTAKFSAEQIFSCCTRMAEYLDCTDHYPKNIQYELLSNSEFTLWFAQLKTLAGQKKSGTESAEFFLYWSALVQRLDTLLIAAKHDEKNIAHYSEQDALFVLEKTSLNANTRLTFLENLASLGLNDDAKAQIVANLSHCRDVPVTLSDSQRTLLAEPFVGTRSLFNGSDFEAVSALLQTHPMLADIARLLHEANIDEDLSLTDYRAFAQSGPEYLRLLTAVVGHTGPRQASRLIEFWQSNHCSLDELQRMDRCVRTISAEGLDAALGSYAGYINMLYGVRFKTISLSQVNSEQERLLVYAITHNKKHFIRLVDDNEELFFRLPRRSILFNAELYRSHFNLNELTVKNLEDCTWMISGRFSEELFQGTYQYTFPELKLLYDTPTAYVRLYHKLSITRLDDRIKVLRQLLKRSILREIAGEPELDALAEKLSQKPLANWQQEDFGHIRGIRAGDVAQMLIHLDQLRHLLPGIQCRTDVMLALRSLEHIDRYSTIEALKADLLESDQDWLALAEDMQLGTDFKARHKEDIIKFLCRDGAGIAQTYLDNLDDDLCPAFKRVVKAELMGQFHDLKYHHGDLERELDYPLSEKIKIEWQKNLSLIHRQLEVQERDDFFSTILLGTQPRRTCLSYKDGEYSDCLLACFDSNKKVLYAERDGQIVGRACIRLTKCRLTGATEHTKGTTGRISFVDLEDENALQETRREGETLTLFLERPYTNGLNPAEQLDVETAFVKLAQQKAEALGTALVLSMDYRIAAENGFVRTHLHLYISASKAGKQYLDSLGGNAETSSEGSYRANAFMLEQKHA